MIVYQSGVEKPPGGTLLVFRTGCGGFWSRSGVKNVPGVPITSPVTGLTTKKQ